MPCICRALDNPQKLKIVAYWEYNHPADDSGAFRRDASPTGWEYNHPCFIFVGGHLGFGCPLAVMHTMLSLHRHYLSSAPTSRSPPPPLHCTVLHIMVVPHCDSLRSVPPSRSLPPSFSSCAGRTGRWKSKLLLLVCELCSVCCHSMVCAGGETHMQLSKYPRHTKICDLCQIF